MFTMMRKYDDAPAVWVVAGPFQNASELLRAMRLDHRSGSVPQDARRQQQDQHGSAAVRYVQYQADRLLASG